jgi:hypothetical protein
VWILLHLFDRDEQRKPKSDMKWTSRNYCCRPRRGERPEELACVAEVYRRAQAAVRAGQEFRNSEMELVRKKILPWSQPFVVFPNPGPGCAIGIIKQDRLAEE